MIKVEHLQVFGWEAAIRGMRNPKNSWDRSDSGWRVLSEEERATTGEVFCYEVGNADLDLMHRLYVAGSEHRKYMRMIHIQMDITAPLYWWTQYDTYKVGTVANSCSRMHKLLAKPFELEDFSFDNLTGYKADVKQFVPDVSEEMAASEIWVAYDNDYSVSNFGRIKHVFRDHYRIISGSKNRDGYIFVTLHGKHIFLHRIVCKMFNGDTYAEGKVVNHIDGNKQNNFADNLEWVTQSENVQHSSEHNLKPKGLSGYTGKFTEKEREEIKRLWDSGEMSRRQIAKRYSVSHTCINDIINDKYKYAAKVNTYELIARPLVDVLNELRDSYLRCEDVGDRKKIWYAILQALPESYNQKRTVDLNYEVAATIIRQRAGHKLDEWHTLVDVFRNLPYMKKIIEGSVNGG